MIETWFEILQVWFVMYDVAVTGVASIIDTMITEIMRVVAERVIKILVVFTAAVCSLKLSPLSETVNESAP